MRGMYMLSFSKSNRWFRQHLKNRNKRLMDKRNQYQQDIARVEKAMTRVEKQFDAKLSALKSKAGSNAPTMSVTDLIELRNKITPTYNVLESELSAHRRCLTDVKARLSKPPTMIKLKKQLESIAKDALVQPDVLNLLQKILSRVIHRKVTQVSNFMNILLRGPPGTGKTFAAELIARFLNALDVLLVHDFKLRTSDDLIAPFVGQTAAKTRAVFFESMESCLFIDEAYALRESSYGREALTELISLMDTYRGSCCVIFAGYKDDIKRLMDTNPGLPRRFPYKVDLQYPTPAQLKKLFVKRLAALGYTLKNTVPNVFTSDVFPAAIGDTFVLADLTADHAAMSIDECTFFKALYEYWKIHQEESFELPYADTIRSCMRRSNT